MFDRRVFKEVDDDGNGTIDRSQRFVYDGDNVTAVFDFNYMITLTNRLLHGPAVDQVFADEDALGEILWALPDNQGTVRDLADYDAATGATLIANHLEYDSFGRITAESDPSVEFLYAYTGREWDADAGLYYYRARWYDAKVGRFLSEDPSGFDAGDPNLLRYAGNSPPNFVDPTGLAAAEPSAEDYGLDPDDSASWAANQQAMNEWMGDWVIWNQARGGAPTDNRDWLDRWFDGSGDPIAETGGAIIDHFVDDEWLANASANELAAFTAYGVTAGVVAGYFIAGAAAGVSLSVPTIGGAAIVPGETIVIAGTTLTWTTVTVSGQTIGVTAIAAGTAYMVGQVPQPTPSQMDEFYGLRRERETQADALYEGEQLYQEAVSRGEGYRRLSDLAAQIDDNRRIVTVLTMRIRYLMDKMGFGR